jgi:predicted transcriptional regulator
MLEFASTKSREIRTMEFTEQVREAIRECGVSRYQIAKETNIPQAALSRFMNGHKGMTLQTLEKLGGYIHVTARPRRRARRQQQ